MSTRHGTLRRFGRWFICSLGCCALGAAADPLRDPMQPPAAAVPAASAGAPRDATDESPRHITMIGNTRHVVDRGRRLSVGDLLGGSRIERIDDDAVWLRDAQGLHRAPLYPGVIRRPTPTSAITSAPPQAPNRSPAKDLSP
jgi:hypothetical protein